MDFNRKTNYSEVENALHNVQKKNYCKHKYTKSVNEVSPCK